MPLPPLPATARGRRAGEFMVINPSEACVFRDDRVTSCCASCSRPRRGFNALRFGSRMRTPRQPHALRWRAEFFCAHISCDFARYAKLASPPLHLAALLALALGEGWIGNCAAPNPRCFNSQGGIHISTGHHLPQVILLRAAAPPCIR